MCTSNLPSFSPKNSLHAPYSDNNPPLLATVNVSAATLTTNKPSSRRNSPAKLWELHSRYHCPIIGTCLDMAELRKLLRQSKIEVEQCSEYELHSIFVSHADSVNRLSKLMQKYLEKKYASYRKRFSAATDKQGLLAVWREAWKQGDIAGAFWAALTHPLMDEDISYEIYGQVHMLSHQMGSLQRADLAKLHRLQQRELALLDQLKELWQTAQARHQHALDLQHEIHNLRLALQAKAAESTDSAEIKQLHTQLQQARQENALLRQRFDNINAQNLERQARIESLENQLQLLQKENVALEKHLQATLTPTTCEDCEMGNSPPFPASAGQRILYVGGRDKMKPHFRELVEKHYGGEFVHHDGGLHGKEHCLKGVLCQADLVFCPIDCISHNTCHAIKQHCKKHNKPMVMLRSESLSAFARGLQASFVDFPQSN